MYCRVVAYEIFTNLFRNDDKNCLEDCMYDDKKYLWVWEPHQIEIEVSYMVTVQYNI